MRIFCVSMVALLAMGCSDSVSTTTSTGSSGGGNTAASGTDSATNGTGAGGETSTGSVPSSGTGVGGAGTSTTSGGGGALGDFTAGGTRPTTVYVPPDYDPSVPAPLLIMLHGYSATGVLEDAYLGIASHAASHGMLYAHPDGTVDTSGEHFWNATDACCNFYGSKVDDSAYLIGLVNEIKSKANIDPKRVYFFGHSNGAFMSHRMACEHAADIAAFVALAGETWVDTTKCKPSEPVSMLEIHGTADDTIFYNGGSVNAAVPPYPSAETDVETWAKYNGCSATPDKSAPNLDLEASLPGAESTVENFPSCKAGGHAELWSIQGGSHIPTPSATFDEDWIQFLLDHPKP